VGVTPTADGADAEMGPMQPVQGCVRATEGPEGRTFMVYAEGKQVFEIRLRGMDLAMSLEKGRAIEPMEKWGRSRIQVSVYFGRLLELVQTTLNRRTTPSLGREINHVKHPVKFLLNNVSAREQQVVFYCSGSNPACSS